MMNGPAARRGRFATNVVSNVGTLFLNLFIGFWFTPFLIHRLGVAAYGLIPLITQITNYLTIITLALNSAVGRWTTIALERREYDEANRYFNASFFGSLALVALLAVPAGYVASHVSRIITVPAGQAVEASWLMGCTLSVFFLQTPLSPFGVATYSMNRFDLRNMVTVTEQLVRVGTVVVLFALVGPRLWYVGLGMVAAALVSAGMNIGLWRKLTPMLRVSLSRFDIRAVGRLASFGGWTSISHVGSLLFLAVDLLVVNKLFGPTAGGRYAAVMSWSTLLRSLAGSISLVFGPTVLYIYARNDIDGLVAYVHRAMKFMGLVLALPIGLICGFSQPLLANWLGPSFTDLAPLMSLMTAHLSINLAFLPLFSIQAATNRVSVPGVVTLAMGATNLGLALLLAGPLKWGLYGVAAAGAIMLTSRNLFFTSVYCAHIVGRRRTVFFRPVFRLLALTAGTAAASFGLSRAFHLAGWFRLGAAAFAVGAVYVAVVLGTQVSRDERTMLLDSVRSLLGGGRFAQRTTPDAPGD